MVPSQFAVPPTAYPVPSQVPGMVPSQFAVPPTAYPVPSQVPYMVPSQYPVPPVAYPHPSQVPYMVPGLAQIPFPTAAYANVPSAVPGMVPNPVIMHAPQHGKDDRGDFVPVMTEEQAAATQPGIHRQPEA
jgi:hypothetical protein